MVNEEVEFVAKTLAEWEPGDIPGFMYGDASGSGAHAIGARVRKSRFEEGDSMAIGSLGQVVSSFHFPDEYERGAVPDPFAYFVVWDDHPGIPVMVAGHKIEAA